MNFPGRSFKGALPAPTDGEIELASRLRAHVQMLAGTIGQRNIYHPEQLLAAAAYIERTFREQGHEPVPLFYTVQGQEVRNIEVMIAGGTKASEIVVVGAHYDSVRGCVGANDNASGMAAALEMARLLRGKPLKRTLRLVAFVNEEPPFFQTESMGSLMYARLCKKRGDKIVAMFTPETIGYYSDARGSQQYPFPFSLFYPDTGNFIAFVGNTASRALVSRSVASFRSHTDFPSEAAALPASIQGIGWSDHWSFWQKGWPAFMVTDTAPFRYPHYHEVTDTPDKIDYERTARVVMGLMRVAEALGNE
ncbi:MAG TPA: M28 family peptidase [Tepidisphaeraceae bacterium]|nr:M28 family peptidase [Tepidisphaeraceae bacterium]